MKVWRINLKTAAEGVDPRQFCLQQGILGVGWSVPGDEAVSWVEYVAKADAEYGKTWSSAVRGLRDRMEVDDLVWTRDRGGIYWLARVTGEWEYRGSVANRKADVVNVRACTWVGVGPVDAVPGRVANSFRGRTLQRVGEATIRAFSRFIFNGMVGSSAYSPEELDCDIYSLLQPDDLEDVVALYLQERGYRIIPSSAKKSTTRYEFVLRHRDDGRKAVVQVKTSASLDARSYTDLGVDEVFLFSARGSCSALPESGIICLDPVEIEQFMEANMTIMPDKVRTWFDIRDQLVA